MQTELLRYTAGTSVKEVIRDLRANQERYAQMGVQYVYVVDKEGTLLGAAPMRDLLLAPEAAPIESLLRGPVVAVPVTATMAEVAELFDEHRFMGLPVVDEQGRLAGAIHRADVEEAEHDQSDEQFRRSQGIVGGEELRTMALGKRFRRRTLWLGVNMLLCLGGAFVIANHEDTLKKAIVVAAMLPIVSATSGNAAMQAAAVSIRELTLGIVGPRSWLRVLLNETMLSLVMAAPLGMAVASLSLLWDGSAMIALAVGLAMTINTVVAVGMGALMPLALRRGGFDPALASGPLTTTLADITGFALLFTWVGWLVK
jgi:magnesium transporter